MPYMCPAQRIPQGGQAAAIIPETTSYIVKKSIGYCISTVPIQSLPFASVYSVVQERANFEAKSSVRWRSRSTSPHQRCRRVPGDSARAILIHKTDARQLAAWHSSAQAGALAAWGPSQSADQAQVIPAYCAERYQKSAFKQAGSAKGSVEGRPSNRVRITLPEGIVCCCQTSKHTKGILCRY